MKQSLMYTIHRVIVMAIDKRHGVGCLVIAATTKQPKSVLILLCNLRIESPSCWKELQVSATMKVGGPHH